MIVDRASTAEFTGNRGELVKSQKLSFTWEMKMRKAGDERGAWGKCHSGHLFGCFSSDRRSVIVAEKNVFGNCNYVPRTDRQIGFIGVRRGIYIFLLCNGN